MPPKRSDRNKSAAGNQKRKAADAADRDGSPPKKKVRKKYYCKAENCTKWAQNGGVCKRHGAKVKRKLCRVKGCRNQVVRGGVRIRHGATVKRCSAKGCEHQAKVGGVCYAHGAPRKPRKLCRVPGCTSQGNHKGGVCRRHKNYASPPQGNNNMLCGVIEGGGNQRNVSAVVEISDNEEGGNDGNEPPITARTRRQKKNVANQAKSKSSTKFNSVRNELKQDMSESKDSADNSDDDSESDDSSDGSDESWDNSMEDDSEDDLSEVKPRQGRSRRCKNVNDRKAPDAAPVDTRDDGKGGDFFETEVNDQDNDELITEVPVDGKKTATASKTPESDHGQESDGTETELNFTVSTSTESDDQSESISSSRDMKMRRTSSPNRAVATDPNAASINTTSAPAVDTPPAAESPNTSPRDPAPDVATTTTPANSREFIVETTDLDAEKKKLCNDALEEVFDAMSGQLTERDEAVKQLKDKVEVLKMGKERLQDAMDELKEKYRDQNTAKERLLKALECERDDLEIQNKQLEKEMESIKRANLDLVEKIEDLNKKLNEMERKAHSQDTENDELKASVNIYEKEVLRRETEAKRLNDKMKSMEGEKHRLQEELKKEKLLREADKKQQSGVIERLRRQVSPASGDEDVLRGLDKEMIEKIKNQIVTNGEGVKLDDIVGLDHAKEAVEDLVYDPLQYPTLCEGSLRGSENLLLFGPPGNGKTMIAKAIANGCGATFFSISSSDLTSKWHGEGEKMVKTLFAVAAHRAPSIIFIDEVDSMLISRKADEDDADRRMKNEFLVQLDGMSSNGRILLIGATNLPQELDKSAIRRFGIRLYIPMPNQQARETLIRNLLLQERHSLNDSDFMALSQQTKGYSGADLKNVCKAAFRALKRSLSSEEKRLIDAGVEDIPPITVQHCHSALNKTIPSVEEEDLQVYDKWYKKNGKIGK